MCSVRGPEELYVWSRIASFNEFNFNFRLQVSPKVYIFSLFTSVVPKYNKNTKKYYVTPMQFLIKCLIESTK